MAGPSKVQNANDPVEAAKIKAAGADATVPVGPGEGAIAAPAATPAPVPQAAAKAPAKKQQKKEVALEDLPDHLQPPVIKNYRLMGDAKISVKGQVHKLAKGKVLSTQGYPESVFEAIRSQGIGLEEVK